MNHSDGSYIGSNTIFDISFPISFSTAIFSILKNLTFSSDLTIDWVVIYRDNYGNNGWDNSKMTVTKDYASNAWQAMMHFFLIVGF